MYKINRTIACIIYYNEIQNIERCLKSINNKFDYIIAIDGAYKEFPHDNFLSTDGSTEVARKYCSRVIIPEREWKDEIEKRNEYMKQLCYGDFVVIIDADEEMIGNIDVNELDLSDMKEDNHERYFYDIKLVRNDNVPPYYIYRAFKYLTGMNYHGTHHALFLNGEFEGYDDYLTNNFKHAQIESFYFKHYQNQRDIKRVQNKGIYYRKLWEQEKDFRIKYGL